MTQSRKTAALLPEFIHGAPTRLVRFDEIATAERGTLYLDRLGPWFDDEGEIIPLGTDAVEPVIDGLTGTYKVTSNVTEFDGATFEVSLPSLTVLIQRDWDRVISAAAGTARQGLLVAYEGRSPALGRIAEDLIVQLWLDSILGTDWRIDLDEIQAVPDLVEDGRLVLPSGVRSDDLAIVRENRNRRSIRLLESKATAGTWATACRMVPKALLQLAAMHAANPTVTAGAIVVTSIHERRVGVIDVDLDRLRDDPASSTADAIAALRRTTPARGRDELSLRELGGFDSMTAVEVAPYLSMLVLRGDVVDPGVMLASIADVVGMTQVGAASFRSEERAGWVVIREIHEPSWQVDGDVKDVVHHVVAIVAVDELLGVVASDARLFDRIARAARLGHQVWSAFEHVEPDALNGAFVQGPAKTLWLSGIHASTPRRPDRKILSGTDLRDALDPLGDQSFMFTAARSSSSIDGIATVGVSPRRSRLWVGPTSSWEVFLRRCVAILNHIAGADPVHDPLPDLASSVSDPAAISGPYEVTVGDPAISSQADDLDEATRAELELWAFETTLPMQPDGTNQWSGVITATRSGEARPAAITLGVEIDDQANAALQITLSPDAPSWAAHAGDVLRRRSLVTIRYESGHTVSGGTAYSMRFRDQRFRDWEWLDFDGYDVSKEKPLAGKKVLIDKIGNEVGIHKSLFTWVVAQYGSTGWLTCDDGGGEIADFAHLSTDLSVLTLIHVKGSGSGKPNRKLSTSDYEIVTGQAIKNLRHLDRSNFAEALQRSAARKTAKATWNEGQLSTRKAMVAVAKSMPIEQRRVVIVQPRVRKDELERSAVATGADRIRLHQLDALLLEARASCQALGAEFKVVGSADISP